MSAATIHSLVVGGTRGLGREVVRLFLEDGHRVSVIGRRAPAEADRAGGAVYWAADLTDAAQRARVLADVMEAGGPLSYVVFLQRFRGEGDAWAGELDTALQATRAVVETIQGRFAGTGDRAMVMVTSIADTFVADGQAEGYHVAKAGLLHLAQYYAVRLGPRGIRVNAVAPGTFVKEESRGYYDQAGALREVFARTIPLGRLGTAAEAAGVIAFLCSPKASFVTGQRIAVDGGVSLVSQEALARRLTGV